MCGIAGAVALGNTIPTPSSVGRMLGMIRHRGPEAAGIHVEDRVALGHARLSIVDLTGGLQPIANEDGSCWIVSNGEVYNYVELMASLKARGHRFRTASDSETILHLYEEHGAGCLDHLIGQYAFALWDGRCRKLLLARDRLGVRPLFYTVVDGEVLFASEIKALFADPRVSRDLDLEVLEQIFTYWTPLPGHTIFRDVRELPAGHALAIRLDDAAPASTTSLVSVRYWDVDFPREIDRSAHVSIDDLADELRERLIDATRLRLRADVPVGAYLSGGLDSSAICALVRTCTTNDLETFAVTFRNQQFDERTFQHRMASALGTRHHTVECDDADVARVFPDVIWHCEVPLLRTGPAPMFLLSRLVRERGFKVVLNGEGADEFMGGYSIFKEAKIRRWWAARPQSRLRPALLRRIHGEVAGMSSASLPFLEGFFGNGLDDLGDHAYSHRLRWRATAQQQRFFSAETRAALRSGTSLSALPAFMDHRITAWDGLGKAQYLEAKLFLSQYLLSSQGDRVAMAHAVEGRSPFLDHRVVEFAATIPATLKLRGLNEKYLLKRAMRDLVPHDIVRRTKQPYRAPISTSFFGQRAPDWVGDVLSDHALRASGLFDRGAVQKLVAKCRSGVRIGEGEQMAIVGIISTQLLCHQFQAAWASEQATHYDHREPVIVEADRSMVV